MSPLAAATQPSAVVTRMHSAIEIHRFRLKASKNATWWSMLIATATMARGASGYGVSTFTIAPRNECPSCFQVAISGGADAAGAGVMGKQVVGKPRCLGREQEPALRVGDAHEEVGMAGEARRPSVRGSRVKSAVVLVLARMWRTSSILPSSSSRSISTKCCCTDTPTR